MTKEQLTEWMQQPQNLGKEQMADLKELCEAYPYFSISRILWLKLLHNINDFRCEAEISRTATYCSDRRKLYFLLYPSADEITSANQESKDETAPLIYQELSSGDYFNIHNTTVEPTDKTESLKSLAQKLREARHQKANATVMQTVTPNNIDPKKTVEPTISKEEKLVYTEEEVIRYIKEKKYEEALKILRVLHLNIPEKSVYFANQIRFIEKIIATIHKS